MNIRIEAENLFKAISLRNENIIDSLLDSSSIARIFFQEMSFSRGQSLI